MKSYHLLCGILCIIVFALFACTQHTDSGIDWGEIEVVHGSADFVGHGSLPNIIRNVALIVEGEIVNEMSKRHIALTSQDNYGNSILISGYSYAELKILKVFKGDAEEGDIVTLILPYFIEEPGEGGYGIKGPRLITVSESTPVMNGEKWLFFLDYSGTDNSVEAYNDTFYPSGDVYGRFPIPDDEKLEIAAKYHQLLNDEKTYFDSIKGSASLIERENIDEYAKKIESGELSGILINSDGKDGDFETYLISEEQFDYMMTTFWIELDNLKWALEPSDYGVYDMGRFDLTLYADVCNEFYR